MKYWAILLFLITSSQKVDAMSVFDIGKTCVFSEVKVKLMRNGEPLKNTKIIRRWEWNALKQDTATTDSNGYFEFPAIYEKSISRLLPVELVIAQGVYVIENGEEKKIWSNSKREPEENSEFHGRPIVMSCEITDEMKIHREFDSIMNTLCKWEI